MTPRNYPHHDYPYQDYPYRDLYDSGAKAVQGRKAHGVSPKGSRSTGGGVRSPLGMLAAAVFYCPFWLAGFALTKIVLPNCSLNAEFILDSCLLAGIVFGLFLYDLRSARLVPLRVRVAGPA